MAHIKKRWIMVALLVIALLWWFRDPFKPYDTMPFSIEPYIAYDSIVATYGFKKDSLKKPITRNYLITGFANLDQCERKIDSLLPTLVDTFYDNKSTCYVYFLKKSNQCNNDYTRWDREWTENFAYTECAFLYFIITVYRQNSDIVSIIKNRAHPSKAGISMYHIV